MIRISRSNNLNKINVISGGVLLHLKPSNM